MKNVYQKNVVEVPRKALCIALAAVFAGPALADDEVARLVKPESTISLGVGQVSGDNQRFGMYNGLNEEGTVGLGNVSVVRRNDETGTWVRLQGRNLGLSTRELGAEYEKQGDYRFSIDFSQLPRVAPYDIHTDLQGIGTNKQSYPAYNTAVVAPSPPLERSPSSAPAMRLKTERQITNLGFSKIFSPTLELKVNFRNDEKDGNRIFGRGYTNAMEFLAEPIDSTTRQLDAILNYTGEKLQLSGGYYGSFFENRYKSLDVTGGSGILNNNPTAGPGQNPPIANIGLPPDNQAHQLHLSGAYQFAGSTRASFKASYATALQNDEFMAVPVGTALGQNMSGRTDLGGRVDTTLVQAGVTSRPLKDLFLNGSLRYEDRDDNTRTAQYVNAAASTTGFNEPRSLKVTSGKGEASYQLPKGFRLIGGVEVEQKERTMEGVRVVGYRERTDETTWRLELKRIMAESLTGSVAYLYSERDGSDYRNLVTREGYNYPNYNNGNLACGDVVPAAQLQVTRCGLLQPIYLADRDRNKIRLAVDWLPLDSLSAQFVFEDAKDDYGRGRGTPDIGARKGDGRLYSVDLAYSLNDRWKLTGWASRSETGIEQAAFTGTTNAAITVWSSDLKNEVDSYAVGFRGKLLNARLDVGADYVYAHDKSKYSLANVNGGPATVASLPDITWKQTSLKVFGKYAVSKDMAVRLDYLFDRRRTNDWTWTGWTYSDGTQVIQNPADHVHFIGISGIYSFR